MIYSSGRVLRNLREQTGKTISEVASDLNISYQAMQAYEAGTRLPRYEVKKINFRTYIHNKSSKLSDKKHYTNWHFYWFTPNRFYTQSKANNFNCDSFCPLFI